MVVWQKFPVQVHALAALGIAAADKRKRAFSGIYQHRFWAVNGRFPLSGSGSSLEASQATRKTLKSVIRAFSISSIFDSSCGDMTWMPKLLQDIALEGRRVHYVGNDIVAELIVENRSRFPDLSFTCLDLVKDPLPVADLVLLRYTLQHLQIQDAKRVLENISNSGSKYLLVTTFPKQSDARNHQDLENAVNICMQ